MQWERGVGLLACKDRDAGIFHHGACICVCMCLSLCVDTWSVWLSTLRIGYTADLTCDLKYVCLF